MIGLGLGLGLGAHRNVGAKLDPATVAYIQRVEADGGNVINQVLTDSIIKAIKADDAWGNVHSIYTSISGIKLDSSNYVTKLYDVMGATNDLISAGTTNKPQHDVVAQRMNGLPVITFVAADSQFLFSDTIANTNNNGQIIAVYNAPSALRMAISGGYITNSSFGMDTNGRLFNGLHSVIGNACEPSQTGKKIASIRFYGGLDSPQYEDNDINVNGQLIGKDRSGHLRVVERLQIGAAYSDSPLVTSMYWNGDIAAHITFNTAPASIAATYQKLNEIFAIY